MKLNELAIIGVAATTIVSCTPAKTEYASYELYPVRSGSLTEMEYTPAATQFTLWAPTADEVRLMLFEAGDGGHAYETISMEPSEEGTWKTKVEKDLMGKFYTFNVKINDKWLGDTPGINAKAVGVNGKRAAIIDMKSTDPEGWADDKRPALASPADVILYEMHHRDMSIEPSSGIEHKGKFLALTEQGTVSPDKLATGIDHLKELGVTHVHLLPSYDYASVDETKLDENKYNWDMIRRITMCLMALILPTPTNRMFVSGNSSRWCRLCTKQVSVLFWMWCITILSIHPTVILNVQCRDTFTVSDQTERMQTVRLVAMKLPATVR